MDSVRPFPWDQLPAVSMAQVRATDLAARALGTSAFEGAVAAARRALGALDLGTPEIRTHVVAAHRGTTFAPRLGDSVCVYLERPGLDRGGVLAVDRALADEAVAVMLGGEWAAPAQDPWDYGVFAYVVSQVLSEATADGAPAVVTDHRPRPREWLVDQLIGPGTIAELAFETHWMGRAGWVRLFIPVPMLEAMGIAGPEPGRLRRLALSDVVMAMPIGVGRVELEHALLRSLRPGDALLLGEHAAIGDAAERGDGHLARLWLSDTSWLDAKVVEGEAWSIELAEIEPRHDANGERRGEEMTNEANSMETTQLMGLTDLRVEAVVARAELTVDELAKLSPGQIVSTDRQLGEPVELVANGKTVARGELVEIEGRVGVRVLSMEPR